MTKPLKTGSIQNQGWIKKDDKLMFDSNKMKQNRTEYQESIRIIQDFIACDGVY